MELMSKLGDFIAFRAAIELAKDRGKRVSAGIVQKCKELQRSGLLHTENVVQQLYNMFSTGISADC